MLATGADRRDPARIVSMAAVSPSPRAGPLARNESVQRARAEDPLVTIELPKEAAVEKRVDATHNDGIGPSLSEATQPSLEGQQRRRAAARKKLAAGAIEGYLSLIGKRAHDKRRSQRSLPGSRFRQPQENWRWTATPGSAIEYLPQRRTSQS
jgi:hypothetical protein